MTNCKLLKAHGSRGGGGSGNGALAAISTAKADRGSRKRLSRMDGPTARPVAVARDRHTNLDLSLDGVRGRAR